MTMKRKEAIKILESMNDISTQGEAIDMAIEALSNKPTDEWCSDCKEYDHEKHCCPRFNRVIRTTLNEAVANLKEEFESAEYEDYEHATLAEKGENRDNILANNINNRFYRTRLVYPPT